MATDKPVLVQLQNIKGYYKFLNGLLAVIYDDMTNKEEKIRVYFKEEIKCPDCPARLNSEKFPKANIKVITRKAIMSDQVRADYELIQQKALESKATKVQNIRRKMK